MAKPIHITVLAPYPVFPAKTGGQKAITLLYKNLAPLVPVTIISTKDNEVPVEWKTEFFRILPNSSLRYINIFLFFTIRKILKEKKSTHLVIEHPFFGWLGLMLKWFCGVKLVIRSHNIESLRFKSLKKWWWGILWNYERFVHRKADLNFFITYEDRKFAQDKYKLATSKCHIITYGFEQLTVPATEDRAAARMALMRNHQINPTARILFFNGMLDYAPNLQAVDTILDKINPLLQNNKAFNYKIIICGKNLPARYDGLSAYASAHIIYAGFVEDITVYYKGADIFINPVIDGGGIKTKLVEALGYNLSGVSTQQGAFGLDRSFTGKKLQIVADNDWQAFTNAIFEAQLSENIPQAFFNHFYWGNIAEKVFSIINKV